MAIGRNGMMITLDTSRASTKNPENVTVGESVQLDGAMTLEAYLANAGQADATLFAGSWPIAIVGGKSAIGFALVPVDGKSAVDIADAFGDASSAAFGA